MFNLLSNKTRLCVKKLSSKIWDNIILITFSHWSEPKQTLRFNKNQIKLQWETKIYRGHLNNMIKFTEHTDLNLLMSACHSLRRRERQDAISLQEVSANNTDLQRSTINLSCSERRLQPECVNGWLISFKKKRIKAAEVWKLFSLK